MSNNEHTPANGEQGRASVTTGSTTQGGSNYGQGSSQLGGESYRQGDAKNDGSNYNNETNKLGNSSVETPESASHNPNQGSKYATGASGTGEEMKEQSINNQTVEQARTDQGQEENKDNRKNEDRNFLTGDKQDTARDEDMNLDNASEQIRESGRSDSGSWSKGSTS